MDSNDTSIVCLLHSWGCPRRKKICKFTVRSLMEQPTQFSAIPLSAQGSYGDEYQAFNSRVLQLSTVLKSCRELFQKGSRKWHPKTQYFIQLSNGPKFYVNLPSRKRGLTIELHLLPDMVDSPSFQWHNPVSVSVYKHLIVAGVPILIVSSTMGHVLCVSKLTYIQIHVIMM